MQQISAKQLQKKLAEGEDFFLLDVREKSEHEEFNIGGKLIPLDQIIRKAVEIPMEKPVIVYCQKGVRSQIAIQRLEQKFNFANLINLAGGIQNWTF
ncbi:rhodanese-like domain-containing protein [Segetibacter koreensis]|uniref:rhodanese-like domain-containing protein n=1 Tax=Segetibacter koreensis TaxID=398037 RepID=UPI0003794FE7|nr:rhodanese-like domain-containing protein [Segetibacter koreensis]